MSRAVKFCGYVVLMSLALASYTARAEVIFFDDGNFPTMVAPTSSRWVPGYDGGICSSATAGPGSLCGPGSFSDEAVWGYLLAPSAGATVDRNIDHYGGLTPIPFDDFLWVKEPELTRDGLFGDYLYDFDAYGGNALYLQFNSAIAAGFECAPVAAITPGATCGHTMMEIDSTLMTAGYVRWSDGTFDQITFISGEHVTPIPEPETYSMLLGGLSLIGFLGRRRKSTAV